MLGGLLARRLGRARPLLRVHRPRAAHDVPLLRSQAPAVHRRRAAAKWGDSILKSYQQMDAIVGEVMAEACRRTPPADRRLRPRLRVVPAADDELQHLAGEERLHDAQAARTTDRKNLEDLFDQGDVLRQRRLVEDHAPTPWAWARSTSTSRAARRRGSSKPGAEYDSADGRDQGRRSRPSSTTRPASSRWPTSSPATRPTATYDPALIPDLFPSNNDGYRVGWQDILGGVAKQIVEPNTDVWSGDHCSVYPPLVDGILFSNRKLDVAEQPYMGDVMPTLLDIYGVQPPTNLDGRSLWKKD